MGILLSGIVEDYHYGGEDKVGFFTRIGNAFRAISKSIKDLFSF